jgi:solute carrier family 13 (sodium-dependent dicarboxylate transporter), member 2/3/5
VIGIILFFLPISISSEGHRMLAVVGIATTLWISEAIPLPVTALLVALLVILFGIGPPSEVFVSFADPIIFLFIGSFILAEAMQVHRLDRRFADAILKSRWVRSKAGRMFFIYSCIAFAISMWISNTATTAMLYPIALSIIHIFPEQDRPPVAHLILLMTSFGASIGGMATPVGTPPNLIGIGFIKNLTNESITFLAWMKFAVPLSVAIFLSIYLVMRHFISSPVFRMPVRELILEKAEPHTKRAQKNVVIAFGITVFLWLLPGFAVLAGGDLKWWEARLPESTAALIGAILLFLLPVDWKKKEFTMRWKDAQNINWGIILLFGGGLVMGKFLFKTGVAKYLGDSISAVYPFHTEFMYILLFTILAVFISEFTSNTASANLILPVAIAVSQAASMNPFKVAIAATLASSLGFMLPISTAPNAIVFGSGMIPIKTMVRYGIVLDFIGAILVALGVYWLA